MAAIKADMRAGYKTLVGRGLHPNHSKRGYTRRARTGMLAISKIRGTQYGPRYPALASRRSPSGDLAACHVLAPLGTDAHGSGTWFAPLVMPAGVCRHRHIID